MSGEQPPAESQDFRFDYAKYQTRSIDIEKLDKIADIVLNAGTGTVAAIIAGIKLLVLGAYLWARGRLIAEKMRIERQEYERARDKAKGHDLESDDLDARPK